MSRIRFMNTGIDNLTMAEALDEIDDLIQADKGSYVVTANVDHIVKLERDEGFRKAYDGASLILADGKPLIWISRLYGTPIKEKISGSDLLPKLCRMAADKKYSVFFLGAADGVAKKAAENLKVRFPGLIVAGCYSPPYGFEKDRDEIRSIIKEVRSCRPDILILALGSPKQERFICRYREKLSVPVSLGLGASLDFISGNVKRAPKWMADHGLEWLYRITQDPKRMARRYLRDDLKIIPLVFKYRGRNSRRPHHHAGRHI